MGSGEQRVIVGIESAIEGGSLSLFRGGTEIDGAVGEKGISRAEEVLPNIDRLLERNGLLREEIGTIVVATGPGSFTGIKIGIATAIGLADGLDCPVVGMSSLEAIAYTVETDRRVLAGVPMGRDLVATQSFEKFDNKATPISFPELITESHLVDILQSMTGVAALYSGLIERLSLKNAATVTGPAVDAGHNIASLIVRGHLLGAGSRNIVPLFIDRIPPAAVV